MENQIFESPEELDLRVDLAAMRTQLAWDRTLLAWVRTVLSLMAAGVAFDKGIRLLHERRMEAGTALMRGAHVVGIGLTSIATLLLAIVCWSYLQDINAIARSTMHDRVPVTPTLLGAMVTILLGCATLIVLVMTN